MASPPEKDHPKLVMLGMLHMAQYFPAAFTGIALPFLFRKEGLPLEMFWLLALPAIPRWLKWLIALVVDNYGSARIGQRKSWIIPCTAIGAAAYAALAWIPPTVSAVHVIVGILLAKSFIMAAQDIAVDGYAAESMTDAERAAGTSIIGFLGTLANVSGKGVVTLDLLLRREQLPLPLGVQGPGGHGLQHAIESLELRFVGRGVRVRVRSGGCGLGDLLSDHGMPRRRGGRTLHRPVRPHRGHGPASRARRTRRRGRSVVAGRHLPRRTGSASSSSSTTQNESTGRGWRLKCHHVAGSGIMIRTQIQLTEEQLTALGELARQEELSVADLVRQSVAEYLVRRPRMDRAERVRRARSLVGRYRSGCPDLAEHHDRHLGNVLDR